MLANCVAHCVANCVANCVAISGAISGIPTRVARAGVGLYFAGLQEARELWDCRSTGDSKTAGVSRARRLPGK